MNTKKKVIANQKLIDLVLEQIKKDLANHDLTALEEMLQKVDVHILKSFLSEVS